MMPGLDNRPLLFLDVDGPLIPLRARPAGRTPAGTDAVGSADTSGNPLIDRLDPADGRRLLALGCQLVWATTWMADANELVSPRLGLPQLPIVDFPDDEAEPDYGLHWKTAFLARCAGGRAFVWLDDEITDIDRRWVQNHYPGTALLHSVDPYVGLIDAAFARIHQWLTARDSRPMIDSTVMPPIERHNA